MKDGELVQEKWMVYDNLVKAFGALSLKFATSRNKEKYLKILAKNNMFIEKTEVFVVESTNQLLQLLPNIFMRNMKTWMTSEDHYVVLLRNGIYESSKGMFRYKRLLVIGNPGILGT